MKTPEVADKRKKAHDEEVTWLEMIVGTKRELEARIFDLEERVRWLEDRYRHRESGDARIGGKP